MTLAYLFLGLLLMAGFVGGLRWLAGADPAALARAVRWLSIGVGAAGVAILVFYGRAGLLMMLAALLMPFLGRRFAQRQRQRATMGPSPAQASRVETAYLDMKLDHDSGRMTGRVRAGRFEGRELGALTLAELLELLAECAAADAQSVTLLEAFLDREHGAAWRESSEKSAGDSAPPAGAMTEDEALQVLGLKRGASKQDITDAYRRLLLKLHPDHGGSGYLAAQIIRAHDLLVGDR